MCDYSDAYIVVKKTIDLLDADANENDQADKNVAFKNNAPFRSCISKINSTLIDNAENLDAVMLMYNLLEYSQIILRHQDLHGIVIETKWMMLIIMLQMVNHLNIKTIVRKTSERTPRPGNPRYAIRPPQPAVPTLNVEVTIPLNYLSNFGRFLDLSLINVTIDSSRTKDCLLIEHQNNITGVNFMITSTKLYVTVVTLSINHNIKFLENIKQGFKRSISWTKYISEITQAKKTIIWMI